MTNESNTQPRPSKEAMEEARKEAQRRRVIDHLFQEEQEYLDGFPVGGKYLVFCYNPDEEWEEFVAAIQDLVEKETALAIDHAKAEGAERVVRAVETACGVGASFARSKDWTIGFDDARGMTVAAARQALQEEKGE